MRNTIIDNIRGLCMLGVLGIHVGSLSIDTLDSFTLLCFLEILSRYSVPTFFFISGYGLFINKKEESYASFIKKRFRGAGLPYVVWSFFYLAYFTLIFPAGTINWHPLAITNTLFFGLACYHLYFMVILLWFYALEPLWRKLVNIINKNLVLGLGGLFIFQVALYWHHVHSELNTQSWTKLAQSFYEYRLNYVPLYYIFVFVLGAIMALHWDNFLANLRKHVAVVLLAYSSATAYFLYNTWTSYTVQHYTFLELVYTYHQLSLHGFLYTIASILAFCLGLDYLERHAPTSKPLSGLLKIISTLSKYSTLIYFAHPLFLDLLAGFFTSRGIILTSKKVALLYFLLLVVTLLASFLLTKLLSKYKLFRLFLLGK